MHRLRIALVVDHFEPRVGGIEVQVATIAQALADDDHAVTVITTTPGSERSGAAAVQRIRTSLMPHYQLMWHPGAGFELRRLLAAERFDVVHVHSSVISPLALAALGIAAQLRSASVLTVHSYLSLSPYFWRACSWVWPWNHAACQLTAVSRYVAERLAKAAGRRDVSVLPNCIETKLWSVDPIPGNRRRLTAVLRLNAKKRPHDLLKAFSAVSNRFAAAQRPKLTIIGDGPLRKSLEREAHRLGIAEQVEFSGVQPQEVIRDVFRTTDVFVHPTRTEAFGLAVLEACLARVPIVAMNFGGVRDLIESGRQGLLANDMHEFVDHIIALLQDDARRRQMADSPRDHLQEFDCRRVLERHYEIYAAAQAAVAENRS